MTAVANRPATGLMNLAEASAPKEGQERNRNVVLSGVCLSDSRRDTGTVKVLQFLDEEKTPVYSTEFRGPIPEGDGSYERKYNHFEERVATLLDGLGVEVDMTEEGAITFDAGKLAGMEVSVLERNVALRNGGTGWRGQWILPLRETLTGTVTLG